METLREEFFVSETSNLHELTIVIPTYQRHSYLLRTLAFVTKFEFASVIVADGSPDSDVGNDIRNLFPTVTYLWSDSGFIQRVAEASKLVKTKYVALWADDEYWLPSFLSRATAFLESNPEYSLCLGHAISFTSSPGPKFGTAYEGLQRIDTLGLTPQERLSNRLLDYAWGGLWGVATAGEWRRTWQYMSQHQLPVRGISELQFELSMAWQGGVKILHELAWFRSLESQSITDSADPTISSFSPLFQDWWKSCPNSSKNDFVSSFEGHLKLKSADKQFWRSSLDEYCRVPYYDSVKVNDRFKFLPLKIRQIWRETFVKVSQRRKLKLSVEISRPGVDLGALVQKLANTELANSSMAHLQLVVTSLVQHSSDDVGDG